LSNLRGRCRHSHLVEPVIHLLPWPCFLRRGSAGMKEGDNNRANNNSNNRRIVDLKTGRTKQEEEYEKTVRLLNLNENESLVSYFSFSRLIDTDKYYHHNTVPNEWN
jgi:hypothetical protein